VPQVGISGFRIDLGIRHPDLAGTYLAGVECDGATYHASATARDRDKVREQVLRGLGWNILRVWSTDWWFDHAGCADRLHTSLENLLEESRARRTTEEASVTTHWDMGHEVEGIDESRSEPAAPPEEASPPLTVAEAERVSSGLPETLGASKVLATQAEASPVLVEDTAHLYCVTDLSRFPADPDQFFEFGYRDVLRGMIESIMETESPLRTDILAQRLARAHGWLRTGGRIRDRIDIHLRGFDTTRESSGEFIWKKGAVLNVLSYRQPASEDARRPIADIPLAELTSVVLDNPELLDEPDPARDLARILGVDRLAAVSRARLDEAIARARQLIATTSASG
jgi:very-short-patch-repair endonuclease